MLSLLKTPENWDTKNFDYLIIALLLASPEMDLLPFDILVLWLALNNGSSNVWYSNLWSVNASSAWEHANE